MAVTQIKGNQVKDATIGIADLSATGTPSSTTYLRGDDTWSALPPYGVPYTGATGDVDLGANNLIALAILDSTSTSAVDVENRWLTDSAGGIILQWGTQVSVGAGGTDAIFDTSLLTTTQMFTFPDTTGTLALTSNTVPYTGATTAVDLGSNVLTAGSFVFASGATIDNFSNSILLGLPVGTASLNFTSLTGNQTYAFPDNTGTVALTSDITGTNSGTNTGDQTTITGNAGSATVLQTSRNINGVAFNGSANITVTADASTLTGTVLNSPVVTSSLTTVGTLTSLTVNSATITLSQDTNFVLSGGVNGVSFDGTTFSIDATSNRVGIGTAAPAHNLHVISTGDDVMSLDSQRNISNPTMFRIYHQRGTGNVANGDTALFFFAMDTTSTPAASFSSLQQVMIDRTIVAGAGLAFSTGGIGNGAEKMRLTNTGKLAIGLTVPTAFLHLKAGSTAATTAPLKFNSGSLMTAPELGAMEYVDNGTTGHLYMTVNVGGVVTRVQLT